MAKYEIIDIDRADQNKQIQISMSFKEMRCTIHCMTKWQAIEFVFGGLQREYSDPRHPEHEEHERRCKFYRTLLNKTRNQLEKILLSKLYLEETITRA